MFDPPVKIVFENTHFVIVDKPGGYLSVPSQWGEEDPRPCLSIILTKQLGVRLWPVHRLDLEVSGILLLAKNAEAHRAANDWFEEREIDKVYEAWSEGEKPNGLEAGQFFEWSSQLQSGKKRAFVSPKGKLSVTRAFWLGEVLSSRLKIQRWRMDPLTGRRHQLRIELAQHGFPILGDALYGSKILFLPNTVALRAVKLDFSNCSKAAKFQMPPIIEVAGLEQLLTSESRDQLGLDPIEKI